MITKKSAKNDKMSKQTSTRELTNGNKIPKIGLGTFKLRGDTCKKAVKTALKTGYKLIDTAEKYKNEQKIGETIKNRDREKLFLTSKVWPTNLHYEDVLKACEKSLERLRTDYLDLYLIHWPNEEVFVGESLDALADLVGDGKVKSVGVSNFTIEQLDEVLSVSEVPITVNQVEFHPWLFQEDLLEFCEDNGVVLEAYAPVARGRFFDDVVVQELSEKYGKTPPQIVLRWEIQKGVVPLPRSSDKEHIRENFEVFDWKLETGDVEKIDKIEHQERLVTFHYGDF